MALGMISTRLAGALAGASMLAAAAGPAAAFTLSSPGPEAVAAGPQIQKVWYDRWGRWHPHHYGYGPLGIVGALGAATVGAAVGTADAIGGAVAGPGPCWRHYYGPYGWHWRRVC